MALEKPALGLILASLFMVIWVLNQSPAVASSSLDKDSGNIIISTTGGGRRRRTTSAAAASNYSAEDQEDDENAVVVSLYYESLCPYCANFIVNQLAKVFQTDLASIVKLRLIPWGNTQITPNHDWVCQHGPDECKLNMVEACAIYVWPNPGKHYQIIYCIEQLRLNNVHNRWQSCFPRLGLTSTPISDCLSTGLAVKLEQRYADETARLNPPHTFVPWVLVNNLPLRQEYQNFVAYICKAYRGRSMPQACKSSYEGLEIMKSVNNKMVNPAIIHDACFAENASSLIQLDSSSSLKQPAAGTHD